MQKRGNRSSAGGWRRRVRREKHVFTTITRALLSKNKNRKKLLSPRSRPGLLPPRDVNANLVKIWFPLPNSAPGGGGRGAEEEAVAEIPRCNSSGGRLAAPHGSRRLNTQSYTHPKTSLSLGPPRATSGLGSLETVLEARGASRGGRGSGG